MNKLVITFVVFLMTACATTERQDDSLAVYLGKKIKDVREELGPPSNIYNMQNGTWQYLWTEKTRGSTGVGTSLLGIPLLKTSRSECTRVLVVDKQKLVVDYGTEGNCR